MISRRWGRAAAILGVSIALPVGGASQAHVAVVARALPYSSASNHVVQPQPKPGSCHATGSGRFSLPDRRCTPGALNPAVRQGTIYRTICRAGWTSMVRPPVSISEPEKFASMAAYGDRRSASHYEYDHLVPLELGGATNAPRNLWPEPGSTPNPKDSVENTLRRQVCDGKLKLVRAQQLIATNWVKEYRSLHRAKQRPPSSGSGPSAWCRVSASYSSSYGDWDVYVHSNQDDRKATVTDSAGRSASWYTNSTGYADIYFHAPHSAAGETIKVGVSTARCSGSL